jgi:putative transposase
MRRARIVIWGDMAIKRSAIPDLLRDLNGWPIVDETFLSPEEIKHFHNRSEAVRLFVEVPDMTITEITRATSIHREQLYRLLERCLRRHNDGRIQGFRALLPNKHLKIYERKLHVNLSAPRHRGGAAGAFSALLLRYPELERWLTRRIKLREKALAADEVREVRTTIGRLHKQFLEKCREQGVKDHEYPFNRDMLGLRSLQSYVARVAVMVRANDSGEAGMVKSNDRNSSKNLPPILQLASLPFEVVQFDGHKIDLRVALKFKDASGLESIFELTRIFILVCLDVATRAVIGYHLVLSIEYDADDIAMALQNCFGVRTAPTLTIPGLSVRAGGGFPSDFFEQAQYAAWRWFQYDNARSHLAEATLSRLTDIVGCYVQAGRLGEPDDRALIERFFATLARNGLHQIPGTTGSSPSDKVRTLADVGANTDLLMTVEELEQVVYVMLADYNGESHAALSGRTPIEAMRYWLTKPGVRIPTLPTQRRKQFAFLQIARLVPVRGGGKKARLHEPHVNFEGVRYKSEILSKHPDLVGKKIRIYFNVRDIRYLDAYFEDGSELGTLVASRQWRTTPHSLRLRKEILRLQRLGKLLYRENEDAVEAYTAYKRRQAPKDKRSANVLAELQRVRLKTESASSARSAPNQADNELVVTDQKSDLGPPANPPLQNHKENSGALPTNTENPRSRKLGIRRTVVFGGRK